MPAASSPVSGDGLPCAGYLGPPGTFSEEALLGSLDSTAVKLVALETIRDAVMAVQERRVRWSLVPMENSIEGSVTVTLDSLAGDATDVTIVGEVVLPVRHYLIAWGSLELEEIQTIVSHPHVPGQCTRFLQRLPGARVVAANSTAEAVRLIAERGGADESDKDAAENELSANTVSRRSEKWAAIGTRLASELYGCTVIAEGIQDREDNETRFVWLTREDRSGGMPPLRSAPSPSKTSLVFWGAGADHAGWLVLCLDEFGRRGINLTKIESRPMRERLGHYMFFVDLEGSPAQRSVSDALAGLRARCERVRVLGSYPTAQANFKG